MKTTVTISMLLLFIYTNRETINSKINTTEKVNIDKIIDKIQNNKKDISIFIARNTKNKASINLYEYKRSGDGSTLVSNSRRIIKMNKNLLAHTKYEIKYEAKYTNSDQFSIQVKFSEDIKVNETSYDYSFKFVENYNPLVILNIKHIIKIGQRNGYDQYSSDSNEIRSYLFKRLKKYNFCLSKKIYKSKPTSFKINFNESEIAFLSKGSNLKLLKEELKRKKLL